MLLRLRVFDHPSTCASLRRFFASPRLETLLRDSNVRDSFLSAVHHFTVPSSPALLRPVKLAFVEPCSLRSFVLSESSFLRQLFQRVEKIYILENSLGNEFCSSLNSEIHSGREKRREERKRRQAAFKDNAKVSAFQWTRDGMVFCKYPCSEHGPFDLVMSDFVEQQPHQKRRHHHHGAFSPSDVFSFPPSPFTY